MDFKITYIGDMLPQGKFRMHSKFSRIMNLANEKGEILSIAEDENFLAPNVIISGNKIYSNIESIEVDNDYLKINDVFFCSMIA